MSEPSETLFRGLFICHIFVNMTTNKSIFASVISVSSVLLCVPGLDRTILLSAMASVLVQTSFCKSAGRSLFIYLISIGIIVMMSALFLPGISLPMIILSFAAIAFSYFNFKPEEGVPIIWTGVPCIYLYLLANMTVCCSAGIHVLSYAAWLIFVAESLFAGYCLFSGKLEHIENEEDVDLHAQARTDAENAKLVDLYGKFMDVMENDRPYLNDNCSLGGMATMVYSNKTYLSKSINQNSGGLNYCTIIKTYRIRYATELIDGNPDMKIAEVALKSGFNNSVSFAAAFKEINKTTVYEYQQRVKLARLLSMKLEQERKHPSQSSSQDE